MTGGGNGMGDWKNWASGGLFVLACLGLLVLSYVAASWSPNGPVATLALTLGAGLVAMWGLGSVGADAALAVAIDERPRLSLSRFQFAAWTLVLFSGWLAAATLNMVHGHSPTLIGIPEQLWVAAGISTASTLISAPVLESRERGGATEAIRKIERPGGSKSETKLLDLVRGETVADAKVLDVTRVQLLLLTGAALIAYGYALVQMAQASSEGGAIETLPPVSGGLLAIMGISHTAYIGRKAVPAVAGPADGDGSAGTS